MLLNAVYFKGSWTHPFDERRTSDETFTTAAGEERPCRMMRKDDKKMLYKLLPHAQVRPARVLSAPYWGSATVLLSRLRSCGKWSENRSQSYLTETVRGTPPTSLFRLRPGKVGWQMRSKHYLDPPARGMMWRPPWTQGTFSSTSRASRQSGACAASSRRCRSQHTLRARVRPGSGG